MTLRTYSNSLPFFITVIGNLFFTPTVTNSNRPSVVNVVSWSTGTATSEISMVPRVQVYFLMSIYTPMTKNKSRQRKRYFSTPKYGMRIKISEQQVFLIFSALSSTAFQVYVYINY